MTRKCSAVRFIVCSRIRKSRRFAEEFSTQWLDLGGVDRVAVNPRYHANFDNRLKPYMQSESIEFFKEILTQDESMMQIIDADFTMLNARLAKHYGMEGPKSQKFERTSLRERTGRRHSRARLGSSVGVRRSGIPSDPTGGLDPGTTPA